MQKMVINGEEWIKANDVNQLEVKVDETQDATFLQIGKVYLIRTVTMIYTGVLKAQSKTELLLKDAAWIAETERWSQTCKDEVFKEVEPYFRDVIIYKGAILDITEITKPQLTQK